jgi:uncharacterized protein (DUF736 family)
MIIGNYTYDEKTDTYTGDVSTLTVQRAAVQFTPNAKSSDKEPDYRIVAETPRGTVELGAAWKKTSERGQDYLSVAIDDPALPGSLNAALFPSEDGETAALVWTRPKQGAFKTEAPAKEKPKSKKAA